MESEPGGGSKRDWISVLNNSPSKTVQEKKNVLNDEGNTLTWLENSVKAAVRKSEAAPETLLKAIAVAIEEETGEPIKIGSNGGGQR